MEKKTVQGGVCDHQIERTWNCALVKSACDEETIFRSSRQMQGAPERGHGGVCLLQETIRDWRLGICISATKTACSPNQASCQGFGKRFLENDDSCKIENTKYGSCGDRCSWSPEDCADSENWNFPSKDCTCDKVRVGGCQKNDAIFCAVSGQACDDTSTWLSPTEVTSRAGIECFLCAEVGGGEIAKAVSTSSGDILIGSGSDIYTLDQTTNTTDKLFNEENIKSIKLYAPLGGLICAFFFVSVAAFLHIKLCQKIKRGDKKEDKKMEKRVKEIGDEGKKETAVEIMINDDIEESSCPSSHCSNEEEDIANTLAMHFK